jgi:uncharacterized membrane protein
VDFPPIPPWEGAHPIVVHFPLALLLIAPVLVALSLLVPKLRQGSALWALAVMALGAAGASLAVATGEATEEVVEHTPEGKAAADLIEQHSEAAETAQVLFLVLTAAYGAMVIVPVVRKKEFPRKADLAVHGVFLLCYGVSCAHLGNVGHMGGRIVHEKGVRAPMGAPVPAAGEDGGRRGRDRR